MVSLAVKIHIHARTRTNLQLFSVNCNDNAHKKLKSRNFDAGSPILCNKCMVRV